MTPAAPTLSNLLPELLDLITLHVAGPPESDWWRGRSRRSRLILLARLSPAFNHSAQRLLNRQLFFSSAAGARNWLGGSLRRGGLFVESVEIQLGERDTIGGELVREVLRACTGLRRLKLKGPIGTLSADILGEPILASLKQLEVYNTLSEPTQEVSIPFQLDSLHLLALLPPRILDAISHSSRHTLTSLVLGQTADIEKGPLQHLQLLVLVGPTLQQLKILYYEQDATPLIEGLAHCASLQHLSIRTSTHSSAQQLSYDLIAALPSPSLISLRWLLASSQELGNTLDRLLGMNNLGGLKRLNLPFLREKTLGRERMKGLQERGIEVSFEMGEG